MNCFRKGITCISTTIIIRVRICLKQSLAWYTGKTAYKMALSLLNN